MSEAAAHLDEVYELARKGCNKETVDSLILRLHALAFEAGHDTSLTATYDTSLTATYDMLPKKDRDRLFSEEQRDRMLEVLTLNEVTLINNRYREAIEQLDRQTGYSNDARNNATRRGRFILKVLDGLRSLQCLVADTEIVVTRLEQEIESLELALAYDQERECY